MAARRRHRSQRRPAAGLLVVCFYGRDNGAGKTAGAADGVDDAVLSGDHREPETRRRHRCDGAPSPGRHLLSSRHVGPLERCIGTEGPAVSIEGLDQDRKSTRLNSSHGYISYAVFCLKKKKNKKNKHVTAPSTMQSHSS